MLEDLMTIIALLLLLALIWQLFKAKRFTRFKRYIDEELQPIVVASITQNLDETRSDIFPNTKSHEEAALYYWCQYRVRVVQMALEKEIIDEKWLKDTGNYRYCQHLFHIENQYINRSL